LFQSQEYLFLTFFLYLSKHDLNSDFLAIHFIVMQRKKRQFLIRFPLKLLFYWKHFLVIFHNFFTLVFVVVQFVSLSFTYPLLYLSKTQEGNKASFTHWTSRDHQPPPHICYSAMWIGLGL